VVVSDGRLPAPAAGAIAGTVGSVERGPVHTIVEVATGSGEPQVLKANVQGPRLSDLGLGTGMQVWVSIEANRVHLCDR
jgi:molybdopterin-binding protein